MWEKLIESGSMLPVKGKDNRVRHSCWNCSSKHSQHRLCWGGGAAGRAELGLHSVQ